jgi:hypothetical protein
MRLAQRWIAAVAATTTFRTMQTCKCQAAGLLSVQFTNDCVQGAHRSIIVARNDTSSCCCGRHQMHTGVVALHRIAYHLTRYRVPNSHWSVLAARHDAPSGCADATVTTI